MQPLTGVGGGEGWRWVEGERDGSPRGCDTQNISPIPCVRQGFT